MGMEVSKITVDNLHDAAAVERAFAAVEPQRVACCNWAAEYPYAPEVTFRMFHTGGMLMLRFDVAEHCTAAAATDDNGPVWRDSCVEFFIAPDDGGYYNFEINCIGTLLLAHRRERKVDVVHAGAEVTSTVVRIPSLAREPFAERQGDNRWSMTAAIPVSALFRHSFASWDGLEARMNLYKCGDNLSKPHFLSWAPISAPSPDFHRPEFFKPVRFGK